MKDFITLEVFSVNLFGLKPQVSNRKTITLNVSRITFIDKGRELEMDGVTYYLIRTDILLNPNAADYASYYITEETYNKIF